MKIKHAGLGLILTTGLLVGGQAIAQDGGMDTSVTQEIETQADMPQSTQADMPQSTTTTRVEVQPQEPAKTETKMNIEMPDIQVDSPPSTSTVEKETTTKETTIFTDTDDSDAANNQMYALVLAIVGIVGIVLILGMFLSRRQSA